MRPWARLIRRGSRSAWLLTAVVLFGCSSTVFALPDGPQAPPSLRITPSAAKGFLAGLPATFEPNEGQAPGEVQFLARASGALLSFERGRILIRLPGRSWQTQNSARAEEQLSFVFPGASRAPQIDGLDPLETKSNYYFGRDPSGWRTNITNYAKLRYHELYPGIDLVFHGESGAVEYDFAVAPGADPGRIRMKITGADGRIHLAAGAVRVPLCGNGTAFLAAGDFSGSGRQA